MGKPPIVERLLPCPFCGATPDASEESTFRLTDGFKWGAVACCGTGPEVRTGYGEVADWKDAAIEAWNTRAVQP
jgi:Lar family restriction alleviation protein